MIAKVFKLIEIGEYETLKRREEINSSNLITKDAKERKIKEDKDLASSEIFVKNSVESESEHSSSSQNSSKQSFLNCDWVGFEEVFVLNGDKIHRKKIRKFKK